jgi:hypothetical protein
MSQMKLQQSVEALSSTKTRLQHAKNLLGAKTSRIAENETRQRGNKITIESQERRLKEIRDKASKKEDKAIASTLVSEILHLRSRRIPSLRKRMYTEGVQSGGVATTALLALGGPPGWIAGAAVAIGVAAYTSKKQQVDKLMYDVRATQKSGGET